MGLSLAEIEKWESASIDAVAGVADGQGKETRMTADQLGMIVDGIRWDGHAADAITDADVAALGFGPNGDRPQSPGFEEVRDAATRSKRSERFSVATRSARLLV